MRASKVFLLFMATIGAIVPVGAQVQQGSAVATAAQYKDPGTATLFSVILTGGGQMYAGETNKGVKLLAIGLGSFVAGEVITIGSCSSGSSCSYAPMAAGSLIYLGTWIYGMMDAGDAARRHNAAVGLKTVEIHPTIRASEGNGAGIGFALRF